VRSWLVFRTIWVEALGRSQVIPRFKSAVWNIHSR